MVDSPIVHRWLHANLACFPKAIEGRQMQRWQKRRAIPSIKASSSMPSLHLGNSVGDTLNPFRNRAINLLPSGQKY
jgi:hypothetical protein